MTSTTETQNLPEQPSEAQPRYPQYTHPGHVHAATPEGPSTPRFLDAETVNRVTQHVFECMRGEGDLNVIVHSWWNGELLWARNRVSLASDRRDIQLIVERTVNGRLGIVITNQLDEQSLESAVRAAERDVMFQLERGIPTYTITPPVLPIPETQIWSDQTYNLSVEQRGALAQLLLEQSEAQSLLSAGYLEVRAGEFATRSTTSATPDTPSYTRFTQAQCSMTVRHPKGVGSGWAGLSSYDWAAIDSQALAARALEKCVMSLNPVAIEPGRYTVVLEPQAAYSLVSVLFSSLSYTRPSLSRTNAETGKGPFSLQFDSDFGVWRSKIGLKIVDERITLSHNPVDPRLGVLPGPGLQPVTWVDRGTLTTLGYDRLYALKTLNENYGADSRPAFRMSGGPTSIDEMIRTTSRGLLVTRFSNLLPVDRDSLLMTGVTRDGLWLIEHGKIVKAVKNLRFTESPLFMLNQLEQLGEPTLVFTPISDPYKPGVSAAIVPPLKAKDFSFTAMVDAV